MTPADVEASLAERLRGNPLVWLAVIGGFGAAGFLLFDRFGNGVGPHTVVLVVWAALAAAYAWNRWRPRTGGVSRSKAEAFQTKRWRLMLLCVGYLALVMVPLAIMEGLQQPQAGQTPIDHIFYAALFLAPCALVVGLMTSAIYSKAWGAAVDDELTVANRASGFRLGFLVFLAAGAIGYGVLQFRPDWASAVLPAIVGLGVSAAGLRFALLERAAAQDG